MKELYFGIIRAGPVVTEQGVFIQMQLPDQRNVIVRSASGREYMDYIFLKTGKYVMFYGTTRYLLKNWKRMPYKKTDVSMQSPSSYRTEAICIIQADRIRTLEHYEHYS